MLAEMRALERLEVTAWVRVYAFSAFAVFGGVWQPNKIGKPRCFGTPQTFFTPRHGSSCTNVIRGHCRYLGNGHTAVETSVLTLLGMCGFQGPIVAKNATHRYGRALKEFCACARA